MTDVPGMPLDQAAVLARTVLAATGAGADAGEIRPVLVATLPWWAAASCEQVSREIVLLRGLLGATAEPAAVTLCLARPPEEPVWADFRRLTALFDQLETELRTQRRRARVPGPAGRRAAAEAAGTRAVLGRAAAEFSGSWGTPAGTGSPPGVSA